MTYLSRTLLAAGLMTLAAYPALAAVRFRTGVFVGPVYGPGIYRPYWGGPGPYYQRVYVPPDHRHEGQLKFDSVDRDADVYVDGGFAGTVRSLNSSWVREGEHDIELRSHGNRTHERVYVVARKEAHVRPENLTPVAP